MFEIFFQHPIITGTIIAAIAAIELCFLIFRFEGYKNFFRRRPWIHLLFQESKSRMVHVSSAILFLITGLAIVSAEQNWLPRFFCAMVCVVALLNFLATLIYDRRNRQIQNDKELG